MKFIQNGKKWGCTDIGEALILYRWRERNAPS